MAALRGSSNGKPTRFLSAAVGLCFVLFGILTLAHANAGNGFPLRTVARVPLSGPANRFDYTSIDRSTHTLWVAHMNAGQLLAVDLRTRRIVKTIDVPGVHGVIAVPELGRVFASATDVHQVLTLDSKGKVLARAPAGDYPDGLAYDPIERHVFISDESGGVETVINTRGRRIATISLGGGAGNVQYDSTSRRVFVDVQSRGDIAVIDPRSNRIVRRISLSGCASPHGLLIDAIRSLAFVACDANARLLTLDLRSMQVIGNDSVGDGPDVLAFDTSSRRLYVSAESGVVAVFAERSRSLIKLGQAMLAPHAHTVAVDSKTHLVYFPLESGTNGQPQLLIMRPA